MADRNRDKSSSARGRPKRARLTRDPSRDPPPSTSRGFAAINQSQSTPSAPSTQPSTSQQPAKLPLPSGSTSSALPQRSTPKTEFLPIGLRPPPGKVAIPSLRPQHGAEAAYKASKKGRIQHACDFCRKAKAGCSGENPCVRCRNAGVECVYGDGKRDKDRKQMVKLSHEAVSLAQHQNDVTDALRKIRLDETMSKEDIRAAIDDILAMNPTLASNEDEISATASPQASMTGMMSGEEDVGAEVGSTGSLDVVNVDTDRDDTRPTGHMGKSSAVAWAKRTAEECENESNQDTGSIGKHDLGFTLASYLTEDTDVEPVDLSNINPFEWPSPRLADGLVQAYFDHVHFAFPIMDKANFMIDYNKFSSGPADIGPSDIVWLSTLNIVFAISSFHANLTKQGDLKGTYSDHLIYCERAKMLCLDQGLLYQDARVSTTRALGLLCLYYLGTCRLNRAWTFCGLAIRQALTLGLHIRSEATDLSDVKKEQRVRMWWSLYSMECLLNELTGRPSCISDRDISTPLPININVDDMPPGQSLYRYNSPDELGPRGQRSRRGSKDRPSATYQMPVGASQPLAYSFPVLELPITPSTYFIYRTQLAIIGHEIVTQLYCAATIKEKWSEVQDTIRRIDRRLLAWRDSLPKEFDIEFDTWPEPDWNDPYVSPRTGLAMLFNSSRMILCRPCLCRFEGRIANQSEKSKEYNQEAVETCINSARKMISLLRWPSRSAARLYSITPWWTTIHYLCEALSVLMLEMAFRSQHLPKEAAYILEDAKKGVNWLAMMSDQSVSARKAWEIFDHLIRVVAPMIKWSVFDMPTEAPVPPGYNWRRFRNSPSFQQQQHEPHLPTQNNPSHNYPQHSSALTSQNLASLASFSPPPKTPSWQEPQLAFLLSQQQYASQTPDLYDHLASNALDQSTAIRSFSAIGNVHGHFDDPWHSIFDFGSEGGAMVLGGGGGGSGVGPSRGGGGGGVPDLGQSGLDAGERLFGDSGGGDMFSTGEGGEFGLGGERPFGQN